MRSRDWPLITSFVVSALASAGCDDQHAYFVELVVSGSPSAVEGRTIKAGPREMPKFKVVNGVGTTFIELCTPSESKFRGGSIPLTVMSGTTIVSTAELKAVACTFAKPPGSIEESFLFLEDDGRLLTDPTSGDVRVRADCSTIPASSSCPNGDDF